MKSFVGILAMFVIWAIVFGVWVANKDRLTALNGQSPVIKNVQQILSTP